MNIHEYQAKELFDRFGVPSPKGKVAATPKEAYDAAKWLAVKNLVVKAQVHAGGRGKGVFKNGFKGGVHLVRIRRKPPAMWPPRCSARCSSPSKPARPAAWSAR